MDLVETQAAERDKLLLWDTKAFTTMKYHRMAAPDYFVILVSPMVPGRYVARSHLMI